MTEQFIRDRITQLRLKKGVSEYKMSLDLGHSKSYIQSITSGKSMMSMSEFPYICEYLGVTPAQFFNTDTDEPIFISEILLEIRNIEKTKADAAERLAYLLKTAKYLGL